MSHSNVETFFNSVASKWDDWANDDMDRVRALFSQIGIKPGDKVLDLACGTGVVTELLHEFSLAPVHGLDIAENMIVRAKEKYQGREFATFEACDFMEYQGVKFDVIAIYNAYPHFLDPKGLSSRLAASLNPEGKFAIVHSLGRKQLSAHHDPLGPKISRDLLPAREEAEFFKEEFEVLKADEGEDFYLIIGAKNANV
ncbi:MAG: methyltransferase domain-containing protein [Bacilli bacterium]|nr:methyltransferase domain-containing protein [Bacilli bacterium]